MDGSRADLESRVALLEGALGDVRARLAALEGGSMPRAAASAAAAPADTLPFTAPAAPSPALRAAAAAEAADEGAPVASALTLAGRTFLVLGGAFLLRTLTEAGRVPVSVGALLGLAYALAWIGVALRDGARGARTSAVVHGLTAALVAYPLVGEAATRMGAFTPAAAAVAVAVVTGALVAAGRRADLSVLVWTGILAGAATAAALFVATGSIAVFLGFLLALYAAALALRRGPGAEGLEWPPGVAAVLFFALGAWLSTRAEGTPERWTALTPAGIALLAAALVALALLGAAHDAKARGLAPTDVLQPAAALTVAAGVLFGGSAVSVLWGLLGIVLAARAPRDGRGWMAWLSAGLVTGAALLSGLLRQVLAAFLAGPDAAPAATGPAVLAAIAALVAFIVAAAGAPSAPVLKPGPTLASAAIASGAVLALAVALAPFTSAAPGLALVRTALLCAAALAAAWTSRWPRLKTLALLSLPILAAVGLKLLFEDLRAGSAATLFAAFALYGATLLLVPRLLRAGSRRSP
ncbi:MAG TPA: hypothetical protein VGM13_10270 [Thermoanaerobaculia bacterium]|jgi:hypothetical protein